MASAGCLTAMGDDSSDEPAESSNAHIPFANAFGEARALREVTWYIQFFLGNAYPKKVLSHRSLF